MSRKPNLALAAMQALSGPAYAQDNSNGGYKPAGFAKPFDGFKTTNIGGGYQSKANDSNAPTKWSGAATYGSGMSVGNMEKNLKRDIQELDWELEMNKKYAPPKASAESEAQLKPKLFSKKQGDKQEFNNTGETRATVSNTVAASDWDLPDMDEPRYTSKPTAHNKVPIPKKPLAAAKPALGKSGEKSNALDWDLGDNHTTATHDHNTLHKATTMPRKQYPFVNDRNTDDVEAKVVGVKNVKNKIDMELEAQDAEFERVYECPEGCGRTFKRAALEKHVKICKKVFQVKNEEGGYADEQAAPAPVKQNTRGGSVQPQKATVPEPQVIKKPADKQKWKQDSENLKKLMKKGAAAAQVEDVVLVKEKHGVVKEKITEAKLCSKCDEGFQTDALLKDHQGKCKGKARAAPPTNKPSKAVPEQHFDDEF